MGKGPKIDSNISPLDHKCVTFLIQEEGKITRNGHSQPHPQSHLHAQFSDILRKNWNFDAIRAEHINNGKNWLVKYIHLISTLLNYRSNYYHIKFYTILFWNLTQSQNYAAT